MRDVFGGYDAQIEQTFLLIPALPPSQVSCDPALQTFLLIPALPPAEDTHCCPPEKHAKASEEEPG